MTDLLGTKNEIQMEKDPGSSPLQWGSAAPLKAPLQKDYVTQTTQMFLGMAQDHINKEFAHRRQ